jgi:hypothetical protein
MKYVIDSSVGVKWVIPEVDPPRPCVCATISALVSSNSSPRISAPRGRQFHHPSRKTSAYHPGRGGRRRPVTAVRQFNPTSIVPQREFTNAR